MILHLLSFLALAGDHANLHPADADLYICAPDLQGAFTASEEIGLGRLLKDPAIVELLGEELGRGGILGTAAESLDLPAEALALLGESAASLSFSIAGLDEFEAAPDLMGAEIGDILGVLFEHELMAIMELSSADHAKGLMALSAAATGELVVAAESSHETPAGEVRVTDYEVMPGDSQHGVWTAQWGSFIAIGLGKAGAPGLVERLGGGSSLAGTDHWARGVAMMREEGGTAHMTYHHNLIGDPWYGLAARDAGLPMADVVLSGVELAFGGIIPLGASEKHGNSRVINGEYVFESVDFRAKAAESSGPLADDFLGLVNPEAVGAWAMTMDPEATAAASYEFFSTLTEIPADVIATEFDNAVGTSLENLLQPLSAGVAFYMLPISGATIPRFHAVVELEDSAAYLEAWTSLAEFLKAQGGEFVEVEDRPYRKIPVFSLKQAGDSGPSSASTGPLAGINSMGIMSPAFTVAILPDRALFGISSSYVKREVRRLLKEEGAGGLHPLAESGAPCPQGVSYFGYLDWPEVIGGIYDTVTAFLPLLGDLGGLPFDVDALPETQTITQCFSPTLVWSRPGDSGTYTLKRATVGPETGISLTAMMAAGFLGLQEGRFGGSAALEADIAEAPEGAFADAPKDEAEPIEEPALTGEERRATAGTRQNLQKVKVGLAIYKSVHGHFPGSLAELLVPTEAFPKGFLDSDALPTDGWSNAFHYSAQPDGAGCRLWSAGPDGVSNGGEGDDVPSS